MCTDMFGKLDEVLAGIHLIITKWILQHKPYLWWYFTSHNNIYFWNGFKVCGGKFWVCSLIIFLEDLDLHILITFLSVVTPESMNEKL